MHPLYLILSGLVELPQHCSPYFIVNVLATYTLNPGVIPSLSTLFMWQNPIIAHDVSIIYWRPGPWPWSRKQGCLMVNSAYFIVWGEDLQDLLD